MRKKTNLMRRVEEQRGLPIDQVLRRDLEDGKRLWIMAGEYGISYWTLRNWCKEYGLGSDNA